MTCRDLTLGGVILLDLGAHGWSMTRCQPEAEEAQEGVQRAETGEELGGVLEAGSLC